MNCHGDTADTERGRGGENEGPQRRIYSLSLRPSLSLCLRCLRGINRSRNEIAEKSQRAGARLPQ